MVNCTLSNSTLLTTNLIRVGLGLLSLPVCAGAIALVSYYRFYRSFNYRLILYLLVSFINDAVANSFELPFVLYHSYTIKHRFVYDVCKFVGFLQVYSLWNIQFSVAFLTAEVFAMIVFSVELQKVEVPLTIACFSLPVAMAFIALVIKPGYGFGQLLWCGFAADRNDKKLSAEIFQLDIPGIILMGICVVATAMAMLCLARRSLQQHIQARNTEEQYLLHGNTRKKYQKALKESMPLSAYPTANQFLFLMYYFTPMNCTIAAMYVYAIVYGSTGIVASAIFFVHVATLGRRRRNTFKSRSQVTLPSNTMHQIHEGQRITAIGSITGTHVTEFDPLEESDVERTT